MSRIKRTLETIYLWSFATIVLGWVIAITILGLHDVGALAAIADFAAVVWDVLPEILIGLLKLALIIIFAIGIMNGAL